MRVERISDARAFFALREEWRALMEQSGRASVFLTHEWLFSWWEVYGAGKELLVLTCRDGASGRLSGIFPAYVRKRGFLRVVRFLGSEHVGSDFLKIIASPGAEASAQDAVFGYLFDHQGEWDIVELTDVLDKTSLVGRLRGDRSLRPYLRMSSKRTVCPYIGLPGGWEEYLGQFSKKARWKLLYMRRNLARHFEVVLREVTSSDELPDAFEHVVRLHQWRRNSKGDRGIFESGDFTAFLKSACARLLDAGLLRLTFLELDGEKVSFLLTMKHGESVYYYQSGLDMAYSRYGVGYVLLGYLIERAINDGCETFEFLRGDEKYKYEWTSRTREMAALFLYNRSLAGRALKVGAEAYWASRNFVKRVVKGRRKDVLPG